MRSKLNLNARQVPHQDIARGQQKNMSYFYEDHAGTVRAERRTTKAVRCIFGPAFRFQSGKTTPKTCSLIQRELRTFEDLRSFIMAELDNPDDWADEWSMRMRVEWWLREYGRGHRCSFIVRHFYDENVPALRINYPEPTPRIIYQAVLDVFRTLATWHLLENRALRAHYRRERYDFSSSFRF